MIAIVFAFSINDLQSQEKTSFSKLYAGIEGSFDFFGGILTTERGNPNKVDAVFISNTTQGNSNGIGAGGRFFIGYRLNELISIRINTGLGIMVSSVDMDFSSSASYNNIGTFSANDLIALNYSFASYEVSVHRLLTELKTRRKRRFLNARFGLGILTNTNNKGIFYKEHRWPIVGIVNKFDGDDSPVVYDDTKLMEVGDWPFIKLGLEYESRGALGITFSFDTHLYKPNLFDEKSIVIGQTQSPLTSNRIALKNNIFSYSITVGFFINRIYRNQAGAGW